MKIFNHKYVFIDIIILQILVNFLINHILAKYINKLLLD